MLSQEPIALDLEKATGEYGETDTYIQIICFQLEQIQFLKMKPNIHFDQFWLISVPIFDKPPTLKEEVEKQCREQSCSL